MNNPNNMLIIESRSNYAFQLRGKNLSFSEIRNTSTAFFTSLPEGVRNELYNNMCHGTVRLDCEPELNAYMYAFGAMHNAKLKDAFSHLSTNFFNEREIDIIDYGCGQAMGCISYADYLRENNHTQNVRRITLIEPSYIALARAALHSSLLFPNAEIVTINKGFDDLTTLDIEVDANIPTLHIFSNVLDMGSTPNYNGVFNLGTFSNLILEISKGYNEYVITEPLFSDLHRDEQADIFISSLFGINVYYEKKCNSGEFVANKNWTCVIKCGCIGQTNVKVSCSHKDSWTWHEFRKLYGKPKLATFNGENPAQEYKRVVFIDESNEANKVYVKFSRLHGELSADIIKQNKDNILICQKTNYRGEKYYELELRDFPTSIDGDGVIPNNEIWYQSSNDKPIKIIKTNHIPLSFNTIFLYGFGLLDSDGKENFGIEIISNENIDGKGVIRFDSSITTIRKGAFDEKYFNEARGEYASICRKEEFNRMFIGLSLFNNDDSANNGNDEKQKRKLCKKSCIDILNYARLASVSFPNSVTIIEDEAFANCVCLASVNLGDNVVSIGNKAFYNCRQLSNIVIPNNTIYIGKGAFENCEHLTSITIPEGVTGIEEGAFKGCSRLTSIILPNSVTMIGKSAFQGCRNLTSVTIPDGVTEIGEYAFSGCQNLISVSIPNSVTKIERFAFSDCSSLKSIDIPYGVFEIGDYAFSGHRVLAYIDIANRKVNERFIGCKSLASVSIPDSVTKIGRCAFDGCCNLRCINIPNSVKKIEKDAFSGCKKLPMKTKLKILKIRMGL